MSSSFVHLHTRSSYSLLQPSSNSISGLVEKASSLGLKALALTDIGTSAGLYKFSDKCISKNIKPILGLEVFLTNSISKEEKDAGVMLPTIVLLAKNAIGWENLCVIVSTACVEGFEKVPRIDPLVLEKHSEGLILLTGGANGFVAETIRQRNMPKAKARILWLKKLFGDDLYAEVIFHPSPELPGEEDISRTVYEGMIQLADEVGVKCVATNDVRYINKDDWAVEDALSCVKQNHRVRKDSARISLAGKSFYMKSEEEMRGINPGRPDLVDNVSEVVDKIENGLIQKDMDLLPIFETPNGQEPASYLRDLVYDGLKKKGLFDNKIYKEKTDYELKVFETCGFITYFLVLHDFVKWARDKGIAMGPGRGSAVGSIALYALDVVKMDPIKYGLLFERFFSVDTFYSVDPSMFGLSLDVDAIDVDNTTQHRLFGACKKHLNFNKEKFFAEGKKMKQLGCLGDFLKTFVKFEDNGSVKTGNINDCNSILAYYAGLTTAEPNSAFVPHEKLVSARVSPPDVDLDFDDKRRDEVYDYLRDKYGSDKAVQIGTYHFYKGKMIIKDVGKILDVGGDWEKNKKMDEELMRARLDGKKAEKQPRSKDTIQIVERFAKYAETGLAFVDAHEQSSGLQSVIQKGGLYYRMCAGLDGLVRHRGVHAAGIVLSKRSIREVCPLTAHKSGKKEIILTQWDKEEVEELGLYKYDILGVINISTISKTVADVKERTGKEIDIDHLEPNDKSVLQLFNNGNTKGIFQFEGNSVTELMKTIVADDFGDLVACNAIHRPGPLKAKVGEKYAAFKHGMQKIEYLHPVMEKVLSETYGLIVYQEQVMNLSKVMASFTTSEADKLRKAVGKKKKDIMDQLRDKFIDGCEGNGIDRRIAVEVWQMIDYFGGYGFNKSHSLAYAYIAYQTAYLKRYHPLEFFCNLLNAAIGDQDKMQMYIDEAAGSVARRVKGLGVKMLPLDINRSRNEFFVDGDGLRLPLTVVKGVGNKAVENIIKERKDRLFVSFEGFVERVEGHAVTKTVIERLTSAPSGSAFKILGVEDKDDALRKFELIKKDVKTRKMKRTRFTLKPLFENFPI